MKINYFYDNKKRNYYFKCFLIILTFIPFILGWENINLKEYFKEIRKDLSKKKISLKDSNQNIQISAYKIMEKMTSILYETKTMKMDVEIWFEHPLFHMKSVFSNWVHNLQDYKIEGRMSFSSLNPKNNYSSSEWVQAYYIRGIPFYWDYKQRTWREESLKLSEEEESALDYTFLMGLFTINENFISSDVVDFLGEEKKGGKDCFVINYTVDPKVFEREGLTGNLQEKIWIDKKNFLPVVSRGEGKIGDAYLLLLTNYYDFNVPFSLLIPSFISKEVKNKKEILLSKVKDLVKEVAHIRGWQVLEDINVEFKNKISFRDFIKKLINKHYQKTRSENEELIFKLLGFLHKDADYKEFLINSQTTVGVGLYDPQEKIILVGDWLIPSIAEIILVHEIVHAFQDRIIDLNKFIYESLDNFDDSFVRKAIVEGEATAIMFEYLLRKKGRSFKNLEDISSLIENKLFNRCQYVKKNIIYNIYGHGTRFVQAYLERHNWPELDLIYQAMPDSMEQIIHPYRKYLIKEETEVEPGDLDIDFSEKWQEVYKSSLGEYLIFLSLARNIDTDTAREASDGWAQDKIFVYRDKDDNKLVSILINWDKDIEALEFFNTYKDYLSERFPNIIEENFGDYCILKNKEGDSFFINYKKNHVVIIWAQSLEEKDFRDLVEQIIPKLKSEI